MKISNRHLGLKFTLFLVLSLVLGVSPRTDAEEQIFRIGTGGNAGTYLPIGKLIANALNQYNRTQTQHQGSTKRDDIEPLDVLVLAQRSNGSVTNVNEIHEGLLESGLTQADVAHWAYQGTGHFQGTERLSGLRAIATLYFESLHLVASTDSQIRSVSDLSGRRVSVDEVGSGTELDVIPVLNAFGLTRADVKIVYLKPSDAIDRLRQGQLDAFFIVAGYPISGVSELVREGKAEVVPISANKIEALLREYPFFTLDNIPAQTYANTSTVPTLAVAAQWVVDAQLDEALIYKVTKALWSESTQEVLARGHPKGREVNIKSALSGLGIPLHPGAQRFYLEQGLIIPDESP